MMNKNDKIYIAGHRGLVGSSLYRLLTKLGYTNLVVRTRSELDLTNQLAVTEFFANEKPDYVFLAAAKVGGINYNKTNLVFGTIRAIQSCPRGCLDILVIRINCNHFYNFSTVGQIIQPLIENG